MRDEEGKQYRTSGFFERFWVSSIQEEDSQARTFGHNTNIFKRLKINVNFCNLKRRCFRKLKMSNIEFSKVMGICF